MVVSKSLESSSTLETNGKMKPAVERVHSIFVDADAGSDKGGNGDVIADVIGVF